MFFKGRYSSTGIFINGQAIFKLADKEHWYLYGEHSFDLRIVSSLLGLDKDAELKQVAAYADGKCFLSLLVPHDQIVDANAVDFITNGRCNNPDCIIKTTCPDCGASLVCMNEN